MAVVFHKTHFSIIFSASFHCDDLLSGRFLIRPATCGCVYIFCSCQSMSVRIVSKDQDCFSLLCRSHRRDKNFLVFGHKKWNSLMWRPETFWTRPHTCTCFGCKTCCPDRLVLEHFSRQNLRYVWLLFYKLHNIYKERKRAGGKVETNTDSRSYRCITFIPGETITFSANLFKITHVGNLPSRSESGAFIC